MRRRSIEVSLLACFVFLGSSCGDDGNGPNACIGGCLPGTVCDSGGTCRPVRGNATSPDLPAANSAIEEWTTDKNAAIAVGTDFACETQLQPEPSLFLLLTRAERAVGTVHVLGEAPLWGIEFHSDGEQFFASDGSVEFSALATKPGETTAGVVQLALDGQSISAAFEAYLCP